MFDPDHLTKNLGIVNSLTVNSFVCVSISHHFFVLLGKHYLLDSGILLTYPSPNPTFAPSETLLITFG